MSHLPSKRAFITGASEGIGREFAIQLAKQSYSITAVARNEERLKSLIQELNTLPNTTGAPLEHTFRVADLSDLNQVKSISEAFETTHYDLLVNNAGFGIFGKMLDTPL